MRRVLCAIAAATVITACSGGGGGTASSDPPVGLPPTSLSSSLASIVEYPTSETLLGGLASAPDNTIYFSTTTQLGIFDTAGKIFHFSTDVLKRPDTWPVIPNAKLVPSGAVSAANGIVSATATETGSSGGSVRPDALNAFLPVLVRLDVATQTFTELNGPANDVFEDLTMTPDGNSYVSANTTTASGMHGYVFTNLAGCAKVLLSQTVNAIQFGTGGNLWVASYPFDKNPDGHIFVIDPKTGSVLNTFDTGTNTQITSLTMGSDGNMWFTDAYNNQIGRITSDGTITRYNVPTPNSGLVAIAPGCACDASLWFTEKNANQIGRISISSGSIAEVAVPTANAGLGDIIGCFNAALWFTETHAIGSASAPVPLP